MSRHARQHQRGFTLTEILVTTAIFAIIMLAALAVYDRSNRTFKNGSEAADLQQSTRIGFDKLISDVRMAGFDYSRGGVPTESWQAIQPDEQIEYAGPTAIVFRANFNYNVPTAPDNGREPAYTPMNTAGQAIFPYVTTSNDEIIAYVLRSTTTSANTGSISFFVDDYRPRSVFPSTGLTPAPASSNPPHTEAQVTITGIDTTNANPPYTLYRVSLANGNCNGACSFDAALGTPVSENIRSLQFQYYSDFNGSALLKNPDNTDIATGRDAGGGTFNAANTGAIGGAGQYDPGNIGGTTNFNDRQQRSLIASVRVNLVGMNASPDLQGYTNPAEPIAAIQKYRQYGLSSLVVPRNLGMTGFPEPNFNAPSPPTILAMCTGHCGAPVIYWSAPTSGGQVFSYHIEWDTNINGAYASGVDITDPSATSAVLPDDGSSDVATPRWYRMEALNDNGQSPPSASYQSTPLNRTRPSPPTALTGTSSQPNQIPLQWVAPLTNASPLDQLTCDPSGSGSTIGANIPPQEIVRYRVYRGTTANFDPTNTSQSVMVLDTTSASQPAVASPGGTVNWIGSGVNSAYPPANCTNYYYRVQALDRCYRQPNWNFGSIVANSISDFSPAALSAAAGPYVSTAGAPPNPPPTASADTQTPNASGCPDPTLPTSPNCRVTLQWLKTFADTAGNRIGVDSYVITRASRIQGTTGAFLVDPLFGTAGVRQVNCTTGTCSSGYSQTDPSAQAQFVDTPPFFNVGGLALEYQYTIAAKNCSFYSGNAPNSIAEASLLPNPQVKFPACSTNPTITANGAFGSGTGDSPTSPWVMNSGDTITTVPNPPVGTVIDSVQYDLSTWPALGTIGSTGPIATAPYTYGWTDQVDNQIYQLRITINSHDASGNPCQETKIKYVQDQQAAGCFYANIPTASIPAPQVSGHGSNPETDTVTVTLTNTGSEPIKFNSAVTLPLLGTAFQGQATFTWHSPDLPNHTDLQLTDIVYSIPNQPTQSGTWGTSPTIGPYSFTDSICAYNVNCTATGSGTTTTSRPVPLTMPDLLPGKTLSIRLTFKFDSRSSRPSLPASPSALTKTCFSYRILSENSVTKRCNLVGQIATTANPTNCD